MPLRPTDAERDEHARRRTGELEETLRRAEEAGYFAGCETNWEQQQRAEELLPQGYRVRYSDWAGPEVPSWFVYWYSGG